MRVPSTQADFDDPDVHHALAALGLPTVSGASRVAAVQALIDKAGSARQHAATLTAHVRRVCEADGNGNRFLARRLVGGGRNRIECARLGPVLTQCPPVHVHIVPLALHRGNVSLASHCGMCVHCACACCCRCAWHIDPDIREACFRDSVRVPSTPGGNGPLRGTVRLPPLAKLGMVALP